MAKKKENWIQKALPASHKGRLHRALGVPEGQKIPESKLESAMKSSNTHLKRMVQMAKNMTK